MFFPFHKRDIYSYKFLKTVEFSPFLFSAVFLPNHSNSKLSSIIKNCWIFSEHKGKVKTLLPGRVYSVSEPRF